MRIRFFTYAVLSFALSGCNGCSKSSQKFRNNELNKIPIKRERSENGRSKGKTIVKMEKRNGVYYVPVELNETKMDFIFDTGASDITISDVEAHFLYRQGTLTNDDFIGVQQYQIADGSISEGSVINLKTVKIGNKILYNVKASIIHNTSAPLLLGQSALNQFGKISIDYNKGEITLE